MTCQTAIWNIGCIFLGRGEDDRKVHEWLTTAASVAEIARRFREWVDTFERARAS